jgi:hypothetical protein
MSRAARLVFATTGGFLRASVPILVIAGGAGLWLGLVLLVLRAIGVYV